MIKRLILLLGAAALVVAAVPGLAAAGSGEDGPIYLSLGTSLAAGNIADADGTSIPESNKSYTNRLHRILRNRVDGDFEHVKLGCSGETADQFMGGVNAEGRPSACADDYATGSQFGDALATLASGDVALVTIDLGANDILELQRACYADPGPFGDPGTCIGAGVPTIAVKVATAVTALRSGGYDGPIVGMNYYNPQIAAAVGYYAGAPGPGPLGPVPGPDPAFAALSDALAVGLNGALSAAYGSMGSPVADVYGAFHAGDFGDDGGRFQETSNDVWDNVDAVCTLTSMCPDAPAKANIHPKPNGYRVIALAFWDIVRDLDLHVDV